MWNDEVGRPVASANYGTNGGSAFSRPDSAPASSDTALVSTTEYNSTGEAYKTVDPAGREDRQKFAAADRTLKTIQNYTDGNPSTGGSDEDVTIETTYNADGQVLTLTAKNSTAGDQVPQYICGTDVGNITPAIYRNDLLRAEIYPDSDDPTDLSSDGVRRSARSILANYETGRVVETINGTLDERLCALQDPNWNVVALADASGDIQERYAHSAYGVLDTFTPPFAVRGGSNYDWETSFAGYRRDQATKLHLGRHRLYQPNLGCWAQRDPSRDARLYQYLSYIQANSISRTDSGIKE